MLPHLYITEMKKWIRIAKMLLQTLLVFALTQSIHSENKFMTAVRNLTATSNTNQTKRNSNGEDNVLKEEISKYLNECKSDLTYDYSDNWRSDDYSTKDRKRSNRQRENYDGGNIDGYLTNYGNDPSFERNRKNSCFDGGRNSERRGGGSYHRNRNGNGRSNNNGGNPYEYRPSYGNERRSYHGNSYNKETEHLGYDYGGIGRDSSGEGVFVRWKRESDDCVTQCIFGYMEILDENSMPSETATVKFLQDRMQNDRKRLKLVRDARRCFAQLATTTDAEDGCESSKTLAKCLKLNIE